MGGLGSLGVGIILSFNLLIDFLNVFLTGHGAVRVCIMSTAMLSEVVRTGKGLVAERAYVGALRGVSANVSSKMVRMVVESRCSNIAYLFKCSNLLNRRPHMGIGHE